MTNNNWNLKIKNFAMKLIYNYDDLFILILLKKEFGSKY